MTEAELDLDVAGQAVVEQDVHEWLAYVYGKPFAELPSDLYIPPDALEVFLETFSGPLDLLLYLIRKNNLDILDIPIAEITRQYIEYVELMRDFRLELASEYLVMAATLAEIKSRMLLPRQASNEDEEELDPRAELVRRLQEYERFKKAGEDIDALPRLERDIFISRAQEPVMEHVKPEPEVNLSEMLHALKNILKKADLKQSHHIEKETLSVREKMTYVLGLTKGENFVPFEGLFKFDEGRLGVVVTFIAILELLKQSMVEIIQNEAAQFSPIHIKAVQA
ncbi:MAG: segregation/condensation protein A [Legionellales bacterium]|nr:segregation/condensation protein A [Legionellales bacterium]